ncbi:hypothetical protein GWI33_007521 [Rhynchophorus ferrugineus]|uniref:Anti-proliferative protein domain-containing protein n=1 Tax=Rhynchophorus ferrugineus TaxID=354439 RepID=A0A834IJR4_RHYFE|nr:hypothetical protein GWI33_007521 [Rhynchophorus ferrugineus]
MFNKLLLTPGPPPNTASARFEKHWFPDLPSKGQGYRCIRVNGLNPVDLILETAATKCGLRYKDLKLPTELTVWVDPNEVCYRLGESEGSYCTLATFPTSDASSTTSSNPPSASSTPPPTSPRSLSNSPTPPHSPALHDRQGMNRRHGHAHRLSGGQATPRPLNGTYPCNGFEFGTPSGKFRNNPGFHTNTGGGRQARQSPREMNFNSFNPHHRPMYPRCDGPPYTMAPPFYRNVNYNRNYKNVLRV